MLTIPRLARRLRSLLTRSTRDAELDEELRFHLEMLAEQYRSAGHAPAVALRMAHRDFGRELTHREEAHDSRGTRPVEDFLQDVRFGVRALGRQRVFTIVAVLTLAVGIGATTAIFGAVYNVLLAPLPFREADRLVTLWEARPGSVERDGVSPGTFLDWQSRAKSFERMAASEPYSLDYVGVDGPENFQTSRVTEGFFELLGSRPLLGRLLTSADYLPGRENVVVISRALWLSRFGGDSAVIGRTLVLDSVPMTVVGVMGHTVDLEQSEQMWVPKLFSAAEREDRRSAYYSVGARLKPGVTIEGAQREMSALAQSVAMQYLGASAKADARVLRLDDVLIGDARRPMLFLLGAVLFVLLVSCSNVANLQLAQAVRRGRELAIRAALGAGRGRLMRQLLAESVVLALVGGGAGVFVAFAGVSAIRALAPADLPRAGEIALNLPMLLFALLLSLTTAVLFGVFPMLEAGRSNPGESLVTTSARSTSSRSRRRAQRALVGGEIALAMMLLVGAGLLMRSFDRLLAVDRGYDTTGVTNVTLQAWNYYRTPAERDAFVRLATDKLRAIPGVAAVGATSSLPLSVPIGMERTTMVIEGQPRVAPSELPSIRVAAATPGYFEAMRNPVRAGRGFLATDAAGSEAVIVVNESFVRRYWPGANPLGRRVTFGFMGRAVERTVVGVVADMRHEGLAADPAPMAFLPHAQGPSGALQFVVRSSLPAADAQQAVRRELAALNGIMPLAEITSLEGRLADSLRERRFQLAMIGAFSATALLLAAIGIFGMMSYITSERTREIGVRIAVGAVPSDVVRMVLGQGARLTFVSVLVGVIGATVLTRFMTSMLYGVGTLDPATYAASALVLLLAAAAACWLPAWRAARIDPVVALRVES